MSELINITFMHPKHVFSLDVRRRDLAAIRKLGRKIVRDIEAYGQAETYETLYRWIDTATKEQLPENDIFALALAIIEDRGPHANKSDDLMLRLLPDNGDGRHDVMVMGLKRGHGMSLQDKLALMARVPDDDIKRDADIRAACEEQSSATLH